MTISIFVIVIHIVIITWLYICVYIYIYIYIYSAAAIPSAGFSRSDECLPACYWLPCDDQTMYIYIYIYIHVHICIHIYIYIYIYNTHTHSSSIIACVYTCVYVHISQRALHSEVSRALAEGVTPVVSYWSNDDMLWLVRGRPGALKGGVRGLLLSLLSKEPALEELPTNREPITVCVAAVGRIEHYLLPWGHEVVFMRDPTRGGLAAVLNEVVEGLPLGILLEEAALPFAPPTAVAAELLGLDLLTVASEGRMLAICRPDAAYVI